MPLYEYVCTKCGVETEALQKFDDAPLTRCEDCNKMGLVRKLSLSAFHLQGGGWFNEGYGGSKGDASNKGAEAGKDTAAASSNGNGAEKKGGSDKKETSGSKESKGGSKESKGSSSTAPST